MIRSEDEVVGGFEDVGGVRVLVPALHELAQVVFGGLHGDAGLRARRALAAQPRVR